MDTYILIGHEPVAASDLLEWARWYGESVDHRRVALTELGGYRVSTIFLGIDHQHQRGGKPLLFETMIFATNKDDPEDGRCWRCATWEEAELQHKLAVGNLQEEEKLT